MRRRKYSTGWKYLWAIERQKLFARTDKSGFISKYFKASDRDEKTPELTEPFVVKLIALTALTRKKIIRAKK